MGISLSSNGRELTVVTGIVIHVLVVGISLSFNGRERMGAHETVVYDTLQLEVVISPSSNRRERMVVTGILVHVPPQQLKVGTSPSSDGNYTYQYTNQQHGIQLHFFIFNVIKLFISIIIIDYGQFMIVQDAPLACFCLLS